MFKIYQYFYTSLKMNSAKDLIQKWHEVLENDESVTSNNKHQDDFDKNCSKHPMSLLI